MELSVVCQSVERIATFIGGEPAKAYRVKFAEESGGFAELVVVMDDADYIPGETYKLTIDQ